jgi:hypothetical protein
MKGAVIHRGGLGKGLESGVGEEQPERLGRNLCLREALHATFYPEANSSKHLSLT